MVTIKKHTHTHARTSSRQGQSRLNFPPRMKGRDLCGNRQVPAPNDSTVWRPRCIFASKGCSSLRHSCQRPIKKSTRESDFGFLEHNEICFPLKMNTKLCIHKLSTLMTTLSRAPFTNERERTQLYTQPTYNIYIIIISHHTVRLIVASLNTSSASRG